jgi:glucokinase
MVRTRSPHSNKIAMNHCEKNNRPMRTYLVGDIGGTNARYALASQNNNGHTISQPKTLACEDYHSLDETLDAYCASLETPLPERACIAIAGPVASDQVSIDNLNWSFSINALSKKYQFIELDVINDFTAQACSIIHLPAEYLSTIKPGQAITGAIRVIVGPGTGLGVSALMPSGDSCYPLASEAGNMPFAPGNIIEAEILQRLWQEHKHVSLETLISGQGLVTTYKTLANIYKQPARDFSPAQVSRYGLNDSQSLCRQALSVFCALLGSAAGSFALAFSGKGGVYLTGGILPRIEDFLRNSEFTQRFCQQGVMSYYVEDIPVYLIKHPQPGLIGATAWLQLNTNLIIEEQR